MLSIRKILRRLWLHERYDIYVKDIKSIYPFNSKYQFKLGSVEDVPLVAMAFRSHFGSEPEKYLCEKLYSGEIMILGIDEVNQRFCFLSWLSKKDAFFEKIRKLPNMNNSLYSYRTFVPNGYRKNGIGKEGISFAEKTAIEKGFQRICGIVRDDNIASQKMLVGQGWKKNGNLNRLEILGKRYIY